MLDLRNSDLNFLNGSQEQCTTRRGMWYYMPRLDRLSLCFLAEMSNLCFFGLGITALDLLSQLQPWELFFVMFCRALINCSSIEVVSSEADRILEMFSQRCMQMHA